MFRQKIIQEFQVLDNVSDLSNVSAPIHNSRDFSGNILSILYKVYLDFFLKKKDNKLRSKILIDNPFQLIKFPAYKRSKIDDGNLKDRRFTRIRNVDSLPIGVWAAWIVQRVLFSF
jgi:hypothetical protein